MKVIVDRQERDITLDSTKKIKELFSILDLNPVSYIVIDCEGQTLLTPDALVTNDSFVELRPVISGG